MQVFVPFASPIETAICLDKRRLNKQILEGCQIIDVIEGRKTSWKNHPVVKMYTPYVDWLKVYIMTLDAVRNNTIGFAKLLNFKANKIKPPFLTEEFCDQHKRRLYTKDPNHYKSFEEYGTSEENWYVVNGKIWKYVNGKLI